MSGRSRNLAIRQFAIAIGLFCVAAPARAETGTPLLGVVSIPTERGAEVTRVVPGSPADKAGIAAGDIVRSVDGFLVGRKGPVVFSLPSEIRRSGGSIRLTIRQQSTNRMVDVTVDVGGPPQPAPPPPVQRRGRLGVLAINSTEGETVTELFPQTPAAAAGLQVNDLITAVDGLKIGRINGNVFSLPSEIRRSQGKIELTVRRGGKDVKIPVDLGLPIRGLATQAHVLLIGLTADEGAGESFSANLELIKARVREAFRGNSQLLDLQILDGNDVTADNVLNLVDRTKVKPTDTLFCYYTGHGAYDPRFAADDPSYGHLLQIPDEDLLRRSLRDHLIEKAARLTVLISDTCNVRAETRSSLEPRGQLPSELQPDDTPPEVEQPLFTHLMRNAGVVDINGASRDQFGWGNKRGGMFTNALDHCLELDRASNWQELDKAVQIETDGQYHVLREVMMALTDVKNKELVEQISKQEHQTPATFILSVQSVAEAPPPAPVEK